MGHWAEAFLSSFGVVPPSHSDVNPNGVLKQAPCIKAQSLSLPCRKPSRVSSISGGICLNCGRQENKRDEDCDANALTLQSMQALNLCSSKFKVETDRVLFKTEGV
jgi:hypothetical protein